MAETPLRCLNACNGRGKCYAGWCHCQEGYYGADCSLSLDGQGRPQQLAGMGYAPAPGGPRIYIYELPPRFTTHKNLDKFDRPLYLFGEAAQVLSYVADTWPWWNATGGARHLLLSTSDLGGCEGKQLMRIRNATSQSVWVTPWGLTRKHPRVWWPGCHRPGLDVVIPIPAQTPNMLMTPLNPKVKPMERNITFYFAGKICGDNKDPKSDTSAWPICQTPTNPLYSAGMRQAPYEPELDWAAFSVPVAEADVPRMHEILAAINDTALARMQRAVACASKHLWWSSMWGGLFGDDGRYDAFATLMEILRVRAAHPGTPPERYRLVDERFRRFADCELDDEPPAGVRLCTYGYDRDLVRLAPTPYCGWREYGKWGIPGGAICEGADNIAQCPRPWQ
eukprot:XP_001702214.1 exostosin-like glycosyltransferase [Chlamydomonas reinhardtii]